MSARSRLCLLAWAALVLPAARSQAPSSQATAAPPASYKILTQDAVTARLKQFSGSDRDRELRIKDWFLQSGCPAAQITEQAVSSGVPPNVMCTLPGLTNSIILVSAHFDYVKRGDGVVDNWSGSALLPSFVSTLRQSPRRHTFVLVAFTAEEKGMFGSEFYARQLAPDQRARIAAVINLDTLGLAPTEVWVSHADPELVSALNAVAHAMKLPLSGVNVDEIGSTDSESFARYKIPRITIHSVTENTLRVLHSPQDRFSAIRLDDYYATYRLLTGYLVYLDGSLRPKPGHSTSPGSSPAGQPASTPRN
jgi:peptidase M28-like protein